MAATEFSLVNGMQEIDKDADDYLLYGVNLADVLAVNGASIASDAEAVALGREPLSIVAAGVETEGAIFIIGSVVCIMVFGGDASLGSAGNSIRIRSPFTNGEQVDRTLHFNIKEK